LDRPVTASEVMTRGLFEDKIGHFLEKRHATQDRYLLSKKDRTMLYMKDKSVLTSGIKTNA
jgi:hypothetical protein